jgi:acyl-CoA thioesterase
MVSDMWTDDRGSQHAGISLLSVDTRSAVAALTVAEHHVNGLGVCHGGYLFLLADTAMAFASNTKDRPALAASASIEFLRPARLADQLQASAVCVASSGRTDLWVVTVTSVGFDEPIAVMHGRTRTASASGVGN